MQQTVITGGARYRKLCQQHTGGARGKLVVIVLEVALMRKQVLAIAGLRLVRWIANCGPM
jgi:hypothetical protein